MWTTRYAAQKHFPAYRFVDMEASCPTWAEQDARRVSPQFELKVTASLAQPPVGARHQLVLAMRDEWMQRLGEARVIDALARIAPHLGCFSAMRARRRDLLNLRVPPGPQRDQGLAEHETPWTAIDGVPLEARRDDVVDAPDSAGPRRRFTHRDGRTVELAVMRGAVRLQVDTGDGDLVTRDRRADDPERALDALGAEFVSDGFVQSGKS
ncbi:MAG: hypothetical protein U0228_12135 [Myxococcaceae bacterium]